MVATTALLTPTAAAFVVNTNTQLYNFIPDLCCAVTQFAEKEAADAVDQLGPIFVKHGVHEKYGLMMIHRHFDMTEGELLVETPNMDHSLSVAMPWTVSKASTLHVAPSDDKVWKSFSLDPQKFVQPNAWAFNDRRPVAFEFYSTREGVDDEDSLPQDFIDELYAALCGLGLEFVFGLRRIRTHLPSFETTPDGLRVNVTHFGGTPPKEAEGEFVKVVYLIGEDGKGKGCSTYCVLHSGSSCHHCSSHTK